MAEATDKSSAVPISELTLGEAESFLNSLMCLPELPNIQQGNFLKFKINAFIVTNVLIKQVEKKVLLKKQLSLWLGLTRKKKKLWEFGNMQE